MMLETAPQEMTPDASSPGSVGDLLLTFGSPEADWPARGSGSDWRVCRQAADWTLWQTAPTDDWRGAPILSVNCGDRQAWLIGELYGTSQPERAVEDVLLGRATAGSLNGHFLLLARHESEDRWHVWTNRFATFHAYYAEDGRRAALGTFFPAVAAAAARPVLDWEGLTTFFGLGFFANDRTHLVDAHFLRPASHYVFDGAGKLLSQERYWEWRHEPDHRRSYDRTLDEFAERFAQTMADLTAAGRVAMPISGGLDSRSTVAAVAAAGPARSRLWAYTYGYAPDSVEIAIGRQVAEARGLPFEAVVIRPYLFDRLESVLAETEGFQDITTSRQASVQEQLRRRADAVIAAHWGDVSLDDIGLAGLPADEATPDFMVDVSLHKVRKQGSDWLLNRLCLPQVSGGVDRILHEAIVRAYAGLGHIADPDFRMKAFKAEQWSARWTTPNLRVYQAAAFPRLPFYDTRLADFFCTVPTEFVAGRRMQIDYLRRYAPDLAAVTWQAIDTDLFHTDRPDFLRLPRRAVKKVWRVARRRPVIERNWEAQFLNEEGRRSLERRLLQSGLMLHEYVPPAAVRDLLDAFYRAPLVEKRGYTVAMLLTFSAWLERYVPACRY